MIRTLLRNYGIPKTLYLLIAGTLFSSVAMYVLIGYFIGNITVLGIILSLIIPAGTAPWILYYLLRVLLKLDLTEETVRKGERKYRQLVKYAPAGIYEIDLSTLQFLSVNDVMCEYTGYTQTEFLQLNPLDLLTEEGRLSFLQRQQRVIKGESIPEAVEYQIKGKNDREFWVLLNTRLMHEAGKPTTATVVVYDITARKQIEAQLRKSLEEKEVLLQEIHHRVKNNMQVISSLLSLQSNYIDNPLVIEYFRDSQARVHSMALVHEKLYRSQDLTSIDLAEYVEDLAHHLFQTHHLNSQNISLEIETESVSIDLDRAIPCGLILNELISNALKHAFPAGQNGEVRVELKTENPELLNLTVCDNGVGFPAHLDFSNSGTLGLQLVNTLVKQLGGTIELTANHSTEFRVRFTVSP